MRVVDSSAWIEWIRDSTLGQALAQEFPPNHEWIIPTIVQYELARWLAREVSDAESLRLMALTTEMVVAPLTTDIATKAAGYAGAYKLAMADAIIYATARDLEADLLTCDAHFLQLPGVAYFPKGPADA